MNIALSTLASALASPSPWLLPLLSQAQHLASNFDATSVAAALNAARDPRATPCFVEQSTLADEPYESFIARTGSIPTRDNLHDLFNGLMWLCFPRTKRRLNELQSREIERTGIANTRGVLRDALTLFDENAALLQAPAVLVEALRRRDWRALFIEQRALWQAARVVVFGHALLEKLMQPRKAITAHVWLVDELTDDAVAASLTERLTSKLFVPLPVLGIPGWWHANEDFAFYDDVEVFRPSRSRS